MRVEKAPEETYADIGGLDDQIMEIKVRGMTFLENQFMLILIP